MQWTPPSTGFLKCNVDASFHHYADFIGVGWILRDVHGSYTLSRSSKLRQGTNPLEAEGLAVLHALQTLWCKGCRNAIMEFDCKELHDLLLDLMENASITPLHIDVRSWVDHFDNVSFTWIPRQGNQVADKLTNYALNQSVTYSTNFFPPRMLRSYLFNDFVNISTINS